MNFYEILGVLPSATFEEIRGAYFLAARRMHPDVNPDPSIREEFLKIQDAFEVLSNISRRERYDQTLSEADLNPLYSVEFFASRDQVAFKKEAQLVYGLLKFTATGEVDISRQVPRCISLVIDRSTSMKGERMEVVKANVLQLFKRLNPQDIISIVTFSDRAELVLPPTPADELLRHEYPVMSIQTSGGTEIFHGLELGYKQLLEVVNGNQDAHLILVTDGHTYGDEEKCFALARDAALRGIVISGLGIGAEWNDEFLDQLASITGGNTSFVRSSKELARYLDEKIGVRSTVFAKNIHLDCVQDPLISLNYAYRISPNTSEIGVEDVLPLGMLRYKENLSILCEFVVNDLPGDKDEIRIIDGWLLFNLPGEAQPRRIYLHQTLKISDISDDWQPPAEILKALSKINLYRMHEKVRAQIKTGNIEGATRYLKNLATNLLSMGDLDLAKVVIRESENIEQHHRMSQEGDKRIKYGTRALLLPSGQER